MKALVLAENLSPQEQETAEQRLAQTSEGSTIRGTVFEGLAWVVKKYRSVDVAEKLLEECGAGKVGTMTKVPASSYVKLQIAAAQELADDFVFGRCMYEFGAGAVASFFSSIAGKTMKLLGGDDPHRLVSAVPRAMAILVDYGNRTYERLDSRSGRFVFRNEYLGPSHFLGAFDTGFREVYGIEVDFSVDRTSLLEFTFKVSW